VYHLFIGAHGVGAFDIQITLQKIGRQGKLHVYIQGGKSFVEPDLSDIDRMRKSFSMNNLEDVDYKTINFNELPRQNISHVTLVVYNTVDTDSEYILWIMSNVSGEKLEGKLIISIAFLILTIVAMSALSVYGVVQYYKDQKTLRQLKFEAEAEVLSEEQEDYLSP
jgi:hypothetical protein